MKRLLNRWPQKLAALLLAILVWYFVSTDDSDITQRRLELPLVVQGLSENQVAVGVPDAVEVIVSGPGPRVDSLRPENFSAVLDLEGTAGDFDKQVSINVLQGITLLQTRPSTVIGTVETRDNKRIPVDVVLMGEPPAGQVAMTRTDPAEVTVIGISTMLAQVAAAAAPAPTKPGETSASLYAVDSQGRPVPGVVLEPASVTVTTELRPILPVKEVPVSWLPPKLPGYATDSVTLSRKTLRVTGAAEALAGLQSAPVTVEFDTQSPEPGSYTLEAMPQLPDGLVALDTLTASLRLRRTALRQ